MDRLRTRTWLAALAAGAMLAAMISTSAWAAPGFSTQGNQILDPQGHPHVFRGVHREWTQIKPDASHPALTEAEVQAMADWRANFVRVPLSESLWLNTCTSLQPSNDPTYPSKVDSWVSWVTSRGMFALLDLHFSAGSLCGPPQMRTMADRQYSDPFWQQVAARYKNNPLVGFDLYNEPHDILDMVWLSGGPTAEGFVAAGMQEMYNLVRGTGAQNLVFISGLDKAKQPKGPVTGNNIVYAVHPYVAPSAIGPLFDSYLSYYGGAAPVMATEYGAPNSYPDQPQEYQAMIDAAEARGLGWCAFAFGPPDPVYNPGAYSLVADANYNPTAAGQVVKNGLAANP